MIGLLTLLLGLVHCVPNAVLNRLVVEDERYNGLPCLVGETVANGRVVVTVLDTKVRFPTAENSFIRFTVKPEAIVDIYWREYEPKFTLGDPIGTEFELIREVAGGDRDKLLTDAAVNSKVRLIAANFHDRFGHDGLVDLADYDRRWTGHLSRVFDGIDRFQS